jgi:hypothetical protein
MKIYAGLPGESRGYEEIGQTPHDLNIPHFPKKMGDVLVDAML